MAVLTPDLLYVPRDFGHELQDVPRVDGAKGGRVVHRAPEDDGGERREGAILVDGEGVLLPREILRDGALQPDELSDEVERRLGRHEALREAEQGLLSGEVHGRRELGHRDNAGVRGERFIAGIAE